MMTARVKRCPKNFVPSVTQVNLILEPNNEHDRHAIDLMEFLYHGV